MSLVQPSTRRLAVTVLSTAFLLTAGAALAAGGGGGGGGSSGGGGSGGGGGGNGSSGGGGATQGKPITDMTTCPRGQVWSTRKKACLKLKSEALPDDDMANYAWVLAKAPFIVPIPGTRRIAHLEENLVAATIALDDEATARIDALFTGDAIRGARYSAAAQAQIDTERFPGE